jgi:hypothetical protein
MTLAQAIKEADRRPKNDNLNYCVYRWNEGYCICTQNYAEKHGIFWVYTTSRIASLLFNSNQLTTQHIL